MKQDKKQDDKIDFVITWVDGSDEKWLEEKNRFLEKPVDDLADAKARYRDLGTLKYWFRSVEKNAPWVNKIYFITWGHLPEWLDTSNEKLVIVNHEDYIPNEILPTFNSNSIEMYMHKIDGLSENFVYFNDDVFIGKKVKPADFFKNGKPKDCLVFNAIQHNGKDRAFCGIQSNNLKLISTKFNKREVVKKNFWKVYNLKYGKELLRTICLMPWSNFTGFYNPHVAFSFKKQSFVDIWDMFGDELYEATTHRIRTETDFSMYLMRYWQLLNGDFIPKKTYKDKYFSAKGNLKKICRAITRKKYRMFCINDANVDVDFNYFTGEVVKAFEKVLPEKSSFEK